MDTAVDSLERIYREVIDLHASGSLISQGEELKFLFDYLAWVAPEADRLWGAEYGALRAVQIIQENLRQAQSELADKLRQIEQLENKHASEIREFDASINSLKSIQRKWMIAEEYLNRGPIRRHFLRKILKRQ